MLASPRQDAGPACTAAGDVISSWVWTLSAVVWLSPKSPNMNRDWMQKEAWNMLNCLSWFLREGLEEGHTQGLGWRQDPFMACVPVPLVLPASGMFLLLLGLGSLFWEEGEGQVLMGSEVLNW